LRAGQRSTAAGSSLLRGERRDDLVELGEAPDLLLRKEPSPVGDDVELAFLARDEVGVVAQVG
jgi:hypothetical protein